MKPVPAPDGNTWASAEMFVCSCKRSASSSKGLPGSHMLTMRCHQLYVWQMLTSFRAGLQRPVMAMLTATQALNNRSLETL